MRRKVPTLHLREDDTSCETWVGHFLKGDRLEARKGTQQLEEHDVPLPGLNPYAAFGLAVYGVKV